MVWKRGVGAKGGADTESTLNGHTNLPTRDPSAPFIDRPLDPEAARAISKPGIAVVANEQSSLEMLLREASHGAAVRDRNLHLILVQHPNKDNSSYVQWEKNALQMGRSLGAECTTVEHRECVEGIRDYCRLMDVRTIFVDERGKGRRSLFHKQSLAEKVCFASGMPPVFVLRPEVYEATFKQESIYKNEWVIQASAIALVSLISIITKPLNLPESFHILLYVFVLALTATRVSTLVSAVGSLAATFAFDEIHIHAIRDMKFSDPTVWFSLIGLLVVSLMISTLSWQLREALEGARRREERQTAFLHLAKDLISAHAESEACLFVTRHIRVTFACEVEVFLTKDEDIQPVVRVNDKYVLTGVDDHARKTSVEHSIETGFGTATFPIASGLYIPIPTGTETIGCIAVYFRRDISMVTQEQFRALHSFASILGQTLVRLNSELEKKSAELRIKNAESRTTLLKGISHDLKTPLTAIKGFAAQLCEDPDMNRDERVFRYTLIRSEARRLRDMIDNLLSMTRLESGPPELNLEYMYAEEVIGTAVALMRNQVPSHPLAVHVEGDVDEVYVDPILLNQVLFNLIHNAAKYSPVGSEILVHACNMGDFVEISVRDRGPGIPEKERERIFEKFVRLESEKGTEGTGLGLSIAKLVVELHGGTISVDSRKGGGSSFCIRLPAHKIVEGELQPAEEV
ncbi:MAG TPA: ATP-binding protein [Fimbriimonas sp.]|nr:ATP-binding protein [Fimbriimonas sp.]